MPDCPIIVLAAGGASRMGTAKQMLDFGGRPLLRHAVVTALESGCGPVVVVLGANHEQTLPALQGLDVQWVRNDRWLEGMGTSIHMGVNSLAGREIQGAILTLADQPFLTPEHYRSLVTSAMASGKRIVASQYAGTVGVPVFFSRDALPLLGTLEPSEGCKKLILAHSSDALLINCPEAEIDVDTPAEYAQALLSLPVPRG